MDLNQVLPKPDIHAARVILAVQPHYDDNDAGAQPCGGLGFAERHRPGHIPGDADEQHAGHLSRKPAAVRGRHSEPDHGGGYSTALLAAYWHDRAASSIIGA